MYMLPELFFGEDRLCPIAAADLWICEEETTSKGDYPCDETVYELCKIIMEENAWDHPTTVNEGKQLYINLRAHVRQLI